MTPPAVHLSFTKWDGSLHWHFDALPLGEDEHGAWLGVPAGTEVSRGDGTTFVSDAFAVLVPAEAWWTAAFYGEPFEPPRGEPVEVYVDVCTPAQWDGGKMTAVDLDLDVVRFPDGTVGLLDEDEFQDHLVRFGYPAEVVDAARAAADLIAAALEGRTEPFDRVGPAWLERLLTDT